MCYSDGSCRISPVGALPASMALRGPLRMRHLRIPDIRLPHGLLQELGCPFSEISAHDSEKLLRVILSSQQPDRCKKAQAFVTTQGMELETVAEIVAEEVTRELLAPLQGKGSEFSFVVLE